MDYQNVVVISGKVFCSSAGPYLSSGEVELIREAAAPGYRGKFCL